jgi:hypothetical protein
MYKRSDSLLVENSVNRYFVRVDTPGFEMAPDGSITLHMAETKPPGVLDGNWLPAQEQKFGVGLRLYYPRQEALVNQWLPPIIKKVG